MTIKTNCWICDTGNGEAKVRYAEHKPFGYGWRRAVVYSASDVTTTESVWQYRYRNKAGNWLLTRRLYTEAEAVEMFKTCDYEQHTGPYEVPE